MADAEVQCVETKRIWKVHKVILCSRFRWFKATLTNKVWEVRVSHTGNIMISGFQLAHVRIWEGRTGVIRIRDTPKHIVDLLLTFIYTGSVNLK